MKKFYKGILTLEIMLVAAIIGIALISFLTVYTLALKRGVSTKEISQAVSLAEGSLEAVRAFRDQSDWLLNGLGTLALGSDYYAFQGGSPLSWQMASGQETVGIFSRRVVFEPVYRDAADNIVSSGGSFDADTLRVRAIVSWKNEEIEIETYLTNWR